MNNPQSWQQSWSVQYKNHQNPCMVTERETGKLLYFNQKFSDFFKVSQDILGKTIDEVFYLHQVELEKFPNWDKDIVFQEQIFLKKTDEFLSINATLSDQGQNIFTEISLGQEQAEYQKFEQAMTRCMDIYLQPENPLISFMELLCEFYESERAYVYRYNPETVTFSILAQWCEDPQFQVTKEINQTLNAKILIDWIQEHRDSGIVFGDRNASNFNPNSSIANILNTFSLDNLTLCVIEDVNRDTIGIVGLSNRKHVNKLFDRRLVHAIARFVAQNVAKVQIDEALFQVHHRDSLTGLYNRIGYSRRISSVRETPPKTLGIVSVNINGLKFLNENYGTATGDDVIIQTSKTLKDHFQFEFFRMSGDEFLGLSPDSNQKEFEEKVYSLQDKLRDENNHEFSMGHAWRQGNYDISKMLQEAETIMYINKQEYYHHAERKYNSVHDNTLSALLSYLENDEFMIYLQPQVKLEDGSLYGAEALIRRFDKKNNKMVFPDQFIPLYEQKSIIRHVDIFVVEQVCKIIRFLIDQNKPPIPISVNLSRVTLLEFDIVDTIAKVCDQHNIPREYLVIEVTERVGLIENNVESSLIQSFKEQGFKISLDDFGCAYSNIVTLAQIDVDEIKIDKSLVDFLTTNEKNHILVKNVLRMCAELSTTSTLAEGIEDKNQSETLHQLGCHLGQGYYYSRPIPVEEFIQKYI